MGLDERLSLGKGLGERLLTNLWEKTREILLHHYLRYCASLLWVNMGTCPAAWPSLCSGRTPHLSTSESDARSPQEHPSSSYKCPPPHVRIVNWNKHATYQQRSTYSVVWKLVYYYSTASLTLLSVVIFHLQMPEEWLLICSLSHPVPSENQPICKISEEIKLVHISRISVCTIEGKKEITTFIIIISSMDLYPSHKFTNQILPYTDLLCSDRIQLQASRAQLSLHLLHVTIMGGRELPDPSVFFYWILITSNIQ